MFIQFNTQIFIQFFAQFRGLHPALRVSGYVDGSGLFQIRQSTSCSQANCILTSNDYFNGFFRFKYFLNVFKDE